jgi:nicotinate (nicotinamide) nucleotide adenylyltransferase
MQWSVKQLQGIPILKRRVLRWDSVAPHTPVTPYRRFKKHPVTTDIHFITGLDAVLTIINWDKAKTYPGLCRFIAATRPGYQKEEIEGKIPHEFRPYITIIEEPALSISSTEIRNRIKTNQPIDGMVPKAVMDYIAAWGLYSGNKLSENSDSPQK